MARKTDPEPGSPLGEPFAVETQASVLGNNNSVLTAKMHMRIAERKLFGAQCSGGATGLDQWLPALLPFRASWQMAMRSFRPQACPRLKAAHRNLVFCRAAGF
jgi:hypothetical protein